MPPSRRRALQFGAAALAGSVTGCFSGALDTEPPESEGPRTGTTSTPTGETATPNESTSTGANATESTSTTTADPTTRPTGVDASLPEGSVEFPDGPKSPPERPADLTAESVREYVRTFEYRYVYNRLYHDETTEVHEECGVDSVAEYGEGYRVVVWCSAYANSHSDGETVHADYFTQYATYFVGPDTTVRRDGKTGTRR